MERPDNLFAGCFCTGIFYADTSKKINGDYKRVAFLPFNTLTLEIKDKKSDLLPYILEDAAKISARKGEKYQTSSSGQYVILGE